MILCGDIKSTFSIILILGLKLLASQLTICFWKDGRLQKVSDLRQEDKSASKYFYGKNRQSASEQSIPHVPQSRAMFTSRVEKELALPVGDYPNPRYRLRRVRCLQPCAI
jgi:hypothetical protein